MTRGVKVLFKRLLAAKGLGAIIALVYWSVGWRIEMLVEGVLVAERTVALKDVSWRIQALLQCMLAAEVSITRLTVLGYFAQLLLRRCRPS